MTDTLKKIRSFRATIVSLSMVVTILHVDIEAYESNDYHFKRQGPDLDNSIYQIQDMIPSFSGPIQNVTVNVGREAVLECPVDNLGQYKVGWLKAKDQTILALHTRVITHNGRIGVDHEESRIWKLRIRQVLESDRGCYMCQLNTAEMKKQIGCIDVLIPPDIDDLKTSSDVIVSEGDDASLVCKANGHPKPTIEWFREDKANIQAIDFKMNQSRRITVDRYNGDHLLLKKVQRHQMGAYLCIASNNVPPAVSKRITLSVNFAPEITVPSQLFGVVPGTDITFSCLVQAFPPAINYWMKNESEMILNGSPKYNISEVESSDYERVLYLTIHDWRPGDQSSYSCISTNSLGKADGRIQSYTYMPKTEREETSRTSADTIVEVDINESASVDEGNYVNVDTKTSPTLVSREPSKREDSRAEKMNRQNGRNSPFFFSNSEPPSVTSKLFLTLSPCFLFCWFKHFFGIG